VSLHPFGVAAKAPHSNAAKLFIDFVLSKEGQQLVLAIGRTPSRPGTMIKAAAMKAAGWPPSGRREPPSKQRRLVTVIALAL